MSKVYVGKILLCLVASTSSIPDELLEIKNYLDFIGIKNYFMNKISA